MHLVSDKTYLTWVVVVKSIIKKHIPNTLLQAVRRLKSGNESPKHAFENVYANQMWGKSSDPTDPFYSGAGSHMPGIVPVYVDAVRRLLLSLDKKLDVVDLGCGDFAVGSQLRNLCSRYIACDVVGPLIARNREKFKGLDVDFRTLDISAEALPSGDVVFIRQVLQHLSNKQISAVVEKVQRQYKYVVLTEHIPNVPYFTPNLDKAVGPDIRLDIGHVGSGVVLTAPPFNLRVVETSILCDIFEDRSVIRTHLYRLQ